MTRFFLLVFFSCFQLVCSQQTDYVDFKKAEVSISIFPDSKGLTGHVIYDFEIIKDVDSIYFDAKNINAIDNARLYNKDFSTTYTDDKIIIRSNFKKGENLTAFIGFYAQPKKSIYFVNYNDTIVNQAWTQGQGKYTSNWLPSFDDENEKVEFDITLCSYKKYEIISNGNLVDRMDAYDERFNCVKFNMNQPMSSYLVALAIGNYNKQTETSISGIPLEYYYYPEDSAKVEPTYRYTKQMFDFLEEEIGVSYPWEIYKQVPVKDFLYSGMENTTLTIFSDAFVVDAIGFNDRNYVNVNAHELAHQWFGNLVTAKSGEHHWLQEGFATYYALLAERDVFGDDYYYWRLYEYANELLQQDKAGQSTALLDAKASSATFYKKGCWTLHILREQVGDTAFKNAVKNYLTKYQFKTAETLDFIKEIESESGQDVSEFVTTWLESVTLPEDAVVKSLKVSEFMQEYFTVSCDTFSDKCQDYLVSDISDEAKIKIVSQKGYQIKAEDFRNSIKVRQAIAENLPIIPSELKANYESLLNDKSYITIEIALYNLWINFPEDRAKYLQATKDIYGLSDLNVRQLWLILHLNTIEYQPDKKEVIFQELANYTSDNYGFEVRQKAFEYLKLIDGFDEMALKNLLQATSHHNWRFQQFSKQLLEELSANENYKTIIETIKNK
jgi:aminopeptidase N